ncbi:bifunctional glutathionylspermidine amidase/glutathionylspermidine synthetase [Thraustotheca clavata]|uniref:Bifunctional glutathionylspermidine amidase/glutathionylspermidine synthetase n=1 Tax=Thraustotheca clavata TaxID=74557 RepID=A0A1V9ZB78_9STRA|nr:bifunctional glutathionylspermidine amidase/glutathionylspermidine synthetase [Thraustotheca clavata]
MLQVLRVSQCSQGMLVAARKYVQTPIIIRSFNVCQQSQMYSLEKVDNSLLQTSRCPFGTLLGICENVNVYSCWNSSCPKRGQVHFHEGVFTGLQWQCVELARRYLVVLHNVTFSSIRFAYQLFDPATKFTRLNNDSESVLVDRIDNGASILPRVGSLLIWDHGGNMKETGHVAVIIRVEDTFVDIIEQNHDDVIWPEGQDYSRRLECQRTPTSFAIQTPSPNETLLGWINIS